MTVAETRAAVAAWLAEHQHEHAHEGDVVAVRTGNGHLHVMMPERQRSLFSPVMDLTLEADGRGGAKIRGRMAPHPNLWTLYVAAYAAFALVACLGASLWLVQWSMGGAVDGEPSGLWALAAAAVGAGGVWCAAVWGRRHWAHQMPVLYAAIDHLPLEHQPDRGDEPLPVEAV